MRLCDRVVAMADGSVIASGTPDEIRNDPAVVEAYLGGDIDAIERSDSAPAQRRPERELVGAGAPVTRQELVLPGVGPTRTDRLLRAFGSVDALRSASADEIAAVPGFGPGTAQRVVRALR